MSTISLEKINEICEKYGNEVRHLLAILQDTQRYYRYLPKEGLKLVSEKLKVPLTKVYEVSTFFKAFSLTPKGEHTCKVCMGTACHLRGAPLILEELERQIGIKSGETSKDGKFSIETVNCVGACAMGPVVVVNDEYYGNMTQRKVQRLIKKLKKQG